jgi:hypothetical protein
MPDELTITLSRCAVSYFALGFIFGCFITMVAGALLLGGGKGHDSQW